MSGTLDIIVERARVKTIRRAWTKIGLRCGRSCGRAKMGDIMCVHEEDVKGGGGTAHTSSSSSSSFLRI